MKNLILILTITLSSLFGVSQNANIYGNKLIRSLGNKFTIEEVVSNSYDEFHVVLSSKYISEYYFKDIIQDNVIDMYSDILVYQTWTRMYDSNDNSYIMICLTTDDLDYAIVFAYSVTDDYYGLLQIVVRYTRANK